MAFEEIKKKGMIEVSGMEGEVGLVAGRSQREKRRSYKDLLREEEEIAAQVRKSSKKRPKDSELFLLGGDPHKKKKKHSSEDYFYRDLQGSGPPPHKKKRKSSSDHGSSSFSSHHQSHSTDTAMGLLQAITSPMATGSDPSPHLHKKPSYPPFSSSHSSSKERKREGSLGGGGKGSHSSSHSHSHSRPSSSSSSSSSKKHSSKSSLYHSGHGHGGGGAGGHSEPLTLREAEGLKMKLILSPKEKERGDGGAAEGFPFPPLSSSSSSLSSSSSARKGGPKKEKDRDRVLLSKAPKKKQQSRDPLPVVGEEVEVEGHYGGGLGVLAADSSSSAGELEAGELVIDDSYTHLTKKKKKSKKSKKKKEKEKDREREKDKSGREKKHSRGGSKKSGGGQSGERRGTDLSFPTAGSTVLLSPEQRIAEREEEEEGGEGEGKAEKEKDKPKKKNMTAYQVFCKEYRVNINAEQPGLVFGELSRKLAEVWKQLPEKDKLVWKQKAQYLQHKQNKAEATTVKRKSSSSDGGKSKGVLSPSRVSVGVSLSPARVPEVDPIDAAAHLQLLGESLSLIGHRLQETEGMVAVSGSLSVLLDSILCALGPLACLTTQVPELNGCPRHVLSNTLDNIAYVMPGL
ncbi:hypothetical protein MATL_G00211340 [Megalops atlanticus]|uniref:HMG box domain-containing protein n=1 Tax=Megalops atlanticus TaxID=7932 RepID=A0A9D3PJH9_MEGAT|nr:hypothetical protein MATL_G00211340 [Megalops atlanticus]